MFEPVKSATEWLRFDIHLTGKGAFMFLTIRKDPMNKLRIFLLSLLVLLAGIAAGLYSYTGPNRSVTTASWERKACHYQAVYDPPGPGYYGCSLTLYTQPDSGCPGNTAGYFTASACGWPGFGCTDVGCSISSSSSTESCSSGDAGCTRTTSTTSLPPATVSGSTSCSNPGRNGWCIGEARLDLSASEPLSGYSITGIESSQGMLCGGDSCTWTFPEGRTSLSFWALSSYGDTSTQASASMDVDTVPPAVSIIPSGGTPGENGWFTSGSVTASASASDSTSGVASASLDGGGSTFTASTDGVYPLAVRAEDRAGNTSSGSLELKIDSTPPTLAVSVSSPDGNEGWYRSPAVLKADASDLTSGLGCVQFRLDNGDWQEGSDVTVSAEGIHTVEFQSIDLAGNRTLSQPITVPLDLTPPQTVFVSPAEGSAVHGREVVLSGQSSDTTSGLSLLQLSLDGGASWQPVLQNPDGTWSTSWDTTTAPNGSLMALAKGVDQAGNEGLPAHLTILVVNAGPSVWITKSFWVSQAAEVRISKGSLPVEGARIVVSDGDGHKRTYRYEAGSLPKSFRWDGLWDGRIWARPGNYKVEVSAWDRFGNEGHTSGTVRIAIPATRTPTPTATPTITYTITPSPTGTPVPPAKATTLPPAVLRRPSAAQPHPETLVDPVKRSNLIWSIFSLVSLLAVLASASLVDPRPRALRRLADTMNSIINNQS
jgi:hypothetical protein